MENSNLDVTAEELKIFLDEAEEQIQRLSEGLLGLERHSNDALLQDIFRAAHTIKGGAATLGRVRMTRLAHALETALNRLRNGELQPEPYLIDLMLKATDGLNLLCRELAGEDIEEVDFNPLREALENYVPPAEQNELPEQIIGEQVSADQIHFTRPNQLTLAEEEQIEAVRAAETNHAFYQISAQLAPDAFLPAARMLQLYFSLLSVGQIIKSEPAISQIEQEQVGTKLQIVIATANSSAEIENVLKAASEFTHWELEPFQVSSSKTSPNEPAVSNQQLETSPNELETRNQKLETITFQQIVSEVKATAAATANLTEGKTIRVNVSQLDKIMNLIGELVVYRTRLSHVAEQLDQNANEPELALQLNETLNYISHITDDLQEGMLKTRMTPVERLFRRMPRLVRDLARQMGKEIEFILEGEQTELDRSIIEEISDPLIHLLRNALDHGIELPEVRHAAGKPRAGTIRLSASYRDGAVFIEVTDDGRGMSIERVRQKAIEKELVTPEVAARLSPEEIIDLIFLPGFSTATTITEVSGRGVGMDIVRTNINRVGGTLTVDTVEGQGSRLIMRLPLTLAIIQALLVTARGSHYAIPLSSITETLRISPDEIETAEGLPLVRLRGKYLPLIALERALGLAPSDSSNFGVGSLNKEQTRPEEKTQDAKRILNKRPKMFPVVAVRYERFEVGLVVDSFLAEQEVVIKPLGWYIGEIPGLTGAMIEGDGRVALIVDVPGLLRATLRGDQSQLRASLSQL